MTKYERTSLWHDVLSIDLSATIIVSCFARLHSQMIIHNNIDGS